VFPVSEKVVRVPVLIASTVSVEVPGVSTTGLCADARHRLNPYVIEHKTSLVGFMVGLGEVFLNRSLRFIIFCKLLLTICKY